MKWLGKQLARLRELEGGAHRVALGVGIGAYVGFFPLLGIKTLLAMGLARLCKGNVVAAVIGATLHDLLLPLAPLLLIWEFKAGSALMGSSAAVELPPHLLHGGIAEWLHWSTLLRLEGPLVLGALVIGIPFGVMGYVLCRAFFRPRDQLGG